MAKINSIIDYFKNIDINIIIEFLIAILIFLLFTLFNGALSYLIIRIFKIKDKNKIKQNSFYKILKVFFPILGAYLALLFLNLPQDVMNVASKVFRILMILFVSIAIANSITPNLSLFKQLNSKLGSKKDAKTSNLIIKTFKCIIYIIAAFIIVSEIGYDLNGLLTGLGLGGVIIALAAQDTAKNIFGGFVILWDKPFLVGDWIETTNFEGIVEDITFRSTRIRTFENSIIAIPNSNISNESLINWSKMKKRRYKENFEIELSTSLKKLSDVQSKIIDMLQKHSRVLNDTLIVKFDKVTENGYNLLINVYTDAITYEDYLNTKENINFNVINILNKENVSLAYPSQTIYVKK